MIPINSVLLTEQSVNCQILADVPQEFLFRGAQKISSQWICYLPESYTIQVYTILYVSEKKASSMQIFDQNGHLQSETEK